MSENKTLSAAKSVNNDEFYTQYNDIDDAESLYEQRSLVTNIVNSAAGNVGESLSYSYDALNRPISRNADSFGYNDRSEVTAAKVPWASSIYGYDEIGNSTNWTANTLNQYTQFTYDLDGNMTESGSWSYTFDAANRLKTFSIYDVLLVTNFYDAKSRRVKKITPEATTIFFYDDWNLIEERIAYTNGTSSTIHYYWGKDLSGTLQGAGGVGGLLYLTVDGAIYIPCYDANGNITRYLDGNGNTVAEYTCDAFGNFVSTSGPLVDLFRHRFSTKYYDTENYLYYYGYRFYNPSHMRWLNRDPLEEGEGVNAYLFCQNAGIRMFDVDGRWTWNEQSAIQEVREKIQEMREDGYAFAADALEHYLRNTSANRDLSQYANEISNNPDWQSSFFKSVMSELKKKDPKGTNKTVEIGDVAHKASFDADLSTGNLDRSFSPMFSHRFNPTQSMSLFYALYGSRYSYIGTASWCQNSSRMGVAAFFKTKVKTDLRIVCWDPLSYAGVFPRTAFPSYSAAQYLHTQQGYQYTYIYLRWSENSNWTLTNFYTPQSFGSFVNRE